MFLWLAFCLALPQSIASEGTRTTRLSLFFPIDKNNIQILPQRFEYELIDKDRFRVGNAVFDARNFSFQVSTPSRNKYKFSARWPSALLNNGEISIRDNIGKSIWTQSIDHDKVRFQKVTAENGAISQIAVMDPENMPAEVFNSLKYVPYFRTCVQKIDPPVRISLCSKDFYIRTVKGKMSIQTRDSLQPESFVNINGNNVDPRGLIFLQNQNQVLALRVLLLSGATLDVDTRLKAVDFRDLSVNEDGDKLMIWAAGTEPTAFQKVNRMDDGSWKTEVDINRPILYLKGEGDIPMKQEFITKGQVRGQKASIESVGDIPTETYSSSVTIYLKKNAEIALSPADNLSTIADDDRGSQRWQLLRLTDWTKNRRLLNVATGDQKFTAAWDVEKYPAWELRIGAAFPTAGEIHLAKWFNGFHFGTALDYKYILTPYRTDDGNTSRARLKLFYSFDKTIQYKNSGWGIFLAPEYRQWGNITTSGGALGLFANRIVPPSWKYFGQWNQSELDLYTMGSGSPSYSNALALRTAFNYQISESQYWFWNMEYGRGNLTDENGTSSSLSRLEVGLGFSYLF